MTLPFSLDEERGFTGSAGIRARAAKPSGQEKTCQISPRTLNGLAQIFKLLADESRLKIMLALGQDGEMHVSALCDMLNQSQPAVSHHLTLMRMAGLVSFRRRGKRNFYRVTSSSIRDVLEQFFADAGNSHQSIHFEDFSLAFKPR